MQLSDQIAASPELMRKFQKERLATEVGELVCRIMREQKVSRAELADRLGTSRAFVTKLLRSDANMTVHTLADVFFALGLSLRVIERPLSVFTPRLAVADIPSDFSLVPGIPSAPLIFTAAGSMRGLQLLTRIFPCRKEGQH